MLLEEVKALIRQANDPGFKGAPTPLIEVTESLINEAVKYANTLKLHKGNRIGLVINSLIREYNNDLTIKYDLKGINYLFSGSIHNRVVIEGSVTGDYFGHRMHGSGEVIVTGDFQGMFLANMMSEGSIRIEGSVTGDEIGEDMSGGSLILMNVDGSYVGKEMSGGEIHAASIKGNYVGEDMSDGLIDVNGIVKGNFLGTEMSGGEIRISEDLIGNFTGEGMYGGSIKVKGAIIGDGTGNDMSKGLIKASNFVKRIS